MLESKIEVSKLFFQIFKTNNILINLFNKNIYSQADFYVFLNSLKLYLGLIASSSSSNEALSKFPRYLFAEKEVFLKIYNLLDNKRIKKIYKNIIKAERLVRKNSELYLAIGSRFLINTKKIITS